MQTRLTILVLLALGFAALPAPPALAAWAVAIAPGGNPIVGRAYDTRSKARREVLAQCDGIYGEGTCELLGSGSGGCVALANNAELARGGTRWGYGKGRTRQKAEDAALAACDALEAGVCGGVHSFCGR